MSVPNTNSTRTEEEPQQEGRSIDERRACPSMDGGQSVLSVVLDIQRRPCEQPSAPRASIDILTRVSGNPTQQSEATSERQSAPSTSVFGSLEVNLSDTVLARSITFENLESRAEARIELIESNNRTQPPSYSSMPPPEEERFYHPPPPPSYEQALGIRYLNSEVPFIPMNNENQRLWGCRSQPAYCVRCNAMVLTNIETHFTWATHLAAAVSCCIMCWPCVVLPYFISAFKEVQHFCPACNTFLGMYRPIQRST